jgi:hypothetical protein
MYGFVFLHLLDYCEQIALLHERHDISIRKSLFKIFTFVLFIRWMLDIFEWKNCGMMIEEFLVFLEMKEVQKF